MTDVFYKHDPKTNDVITYCVTNDQLFVTIAFGSCDILRSPDRLLTVAAAAVNGTVLEACAALAGSPVESEQLSPYAVDSELRDYFGGVENGFVGK